MARKRSRTRGVQLLVWGVAAAAAIGLVLGSAGGSPAPRRIESLLVGGVRRTYHLHVPAHPAAARLPLVLVFHGGGGTGAGAERIFGFDRLADERSFAVVYPDGLGRRWNDERGETVPAWGRRGAPDDFGFITALLARLTATLPIDPNRIVATGISNGAFLSFMLACRLSDKIAAIGPVAGSISTTEAARCGPHRPVSVAAFHGTDDHFVPYQGGAIMGQARRGTVLSAADSAALWARLDGCPLEPSVRALPPIAPEDRTRIRRLTYDRCRGGSAVVLYTIVGGGHTWPGAEPVPLLGVLLGPISRQVNTTDVLWQFFADHSHR